MLDIEIVEVNIVIDYADENHNSIRIKFAEIEKVFSIDNPEACHIKVYDFMTNHLSKYRFVSKNSNKIYRFIVNEKVMCNTSLKNSSFVDIIRSYLMKISSGYITGDILDLFMYLQSTRIEMNIMDALNQNC